MTNAQLDEILDKAGIEFDQDGYARYHYTRDAFARLAVLILDAAKARDDLDKAGLGFMDL
jgi:hypothetical protein